MAKFTPKVEEEIVSDLASSVTSKTPLNDLNPGSVILTILEAVAAEDAEQYMQMLEIINGYSIDTLTGADLDSRASEFNLTRLDAKKATGNVTISDSSITKVSVNIAPTFAAPAAGQTFINAQKTADFPSSGSIVIGRGTDNLETIAYSSIDNSDPVFTKFVLNTGLTNPHDTTETIVLSQGGARITPANTVVRIPSTDTSDTIQFVTKSVATILDGEKSITGVEIEAITAGTQGNAPANSINEFESLPFANAEVTNPLTFTNGRNEETDAELRDRIKATIQGLSKGTKNAIELAAIGVEYENQRVVSASIVEPTSVAGVNKLYIDDGTGFDETKTGIGLENIVVSATGGEKFLQVDNFPIVKSIYVSNLNNKVDFDEGGGELNATLDEGFYTLAEFMQELEDQLNTTGSNTYTVSETDGEKIKIVSDASVDFLWKTGTNGLDNGLRNAGKLIGFDINSDTENKTIYIADYQPTILTLTKNKRTLSSVTLTNGSTATSGISPGDVSIGEYLKVSTDDKDAWARVESVGPVVLSWNYEGAGGSSVDVEAIDFLHTDKYTLNRFIGQLELDTALVSGDKIVLGDLSIRASVESGNAENYDLSSDTSLASVATFTTGSTTVTGTGLDSDVSVGDYVKVDADTGGSLTGTLTFTKGSQTVTGSGTSFTTELNSGDFIKLDSDDETHFARVSSIASNTSLTLTTGYTGTSGGGAASNSDPWALVESVDSSTEITLAWAYAGSGGAGAAASVAALDDLLVKINGADSQSIEFLPIDFGTLGAGTAQEVSNRIKKDISNGTSVLSPQTGNDKLKILSNNFGTAGSVQVVGGSANTALNFSTTKKDGIDGYQYFTELVQEVQHVIDGNTSKNYEQVRAAGTQVNVLTPNVQNQTLAITITPINSVTVDSLRAEVREKTVNYINNLRIGEDVVLSEITSSIQDIVGVFDVEITSPTSNVAIGDDELARIVDSSITVS